MKFKNQKKELLSIIDFRKSFVFALLFAFLSAGHASNNLSQTKGALPVKYTDEKGVEKNQDIPILMDKDTDQEKLAESSPERLAETVEELIITSQNSKQRGVSDNVLLNTAINFPKSSATFFAGVGLVAMMDLIVKYEHNPVGLYQHFVAQKDPLTHISFFMFMLASGSIQKPLSMFLKSPKSIARIPYLGMSMGMLASQLSSELLNAFRDCGKELVNSKNLAKTYPVCQKNYNDLVMTDKIIDMAPSLVSMLLASQASAFIQRTVATKIKTGATAKLVNFGLKWSGVNLALSVMPGGIKVMSQHLLLEVVQAFLFVGIQKYIDPWVMEPFQNVLKGTSLKMLSNDIDDQIVIAKAEKWPVSENDCAFSEVLNNPYSLSGEPQKICDKSLIGNLKDFQKKMVAWRLLNLSSVMTAYQGWNQKIEKLSGMRGAAEEFYAYFLSEIQAAVDKRMTPYPKIWRVAPYNGVKAFIPQGFDEIPPETGLTSPETLEKFQREKVRQTVVLIEKELGAGGLYDEQNFPILEQTKLKAEAQLVAQIIADLKSDNNQTLSRGLIKIHDLRTNFRSISNTSRMTDLLKKIVDFMGLPEPEMVPGRAFLFAFKDHPYYKTLFKDVEYSNASGRYVFKDISEYFVFQMICGPDAEKQNPDQLVIEEKGWRDELLPPQVRLPDDKIYYFCDKSSGPATIKMYSDPLYADTAEGRMVFKGPLDYLANRTRNSVLNGNFNKWWESKIQIQIDSALEDYDKQYAVIARDFIKAALTQTFHYQDKKFLAIAGEIAEKIKQGELDFFNAGPVSNGAVLATEQESHLYLLILSEMLKDLLGSNTHQDQSEILAKIQAVSMRFSEFFKAFKSLNPDKTLPSQNKTLIEIKQNALKLGEEIQKLRTDLDEPLKTALKPGQFKLAQFCLEALEKLQKESDNYAMMLTFVVIGTDTNNVEQILNKSKDRADEIKEKMKK